ncbi:hypothetical protein T265_01151, partial [Opisthorchis viverrini]
CRMPTASLLIRPLHTQQEISSSISNGEPYKVITTLMNSLQTVDTEGMKHDIVPLQYYHSAVLA